MSRISELLAAMTLEEKIGQLVMVSLGAETIVTGPKAAQEPSVADVRAGRVGSALNLVGRDRIHALQKVAIEESRLKIPLLFGLDVVHGYFTNAPAPLGETAAFRPDLWEKTARLAAEEACDDGIHLTFAPMLDCARDPRWGRIVEGPGEDPTVGRAFARAKVRGFQGDDPASPWSLAATAKHFAAYGAATAGRDYASAEISERTLHEVYLPAFEAAVKTGCLAIMPAFSDIAGRPVTGDRRLLTELVRERWGFEGIYVSDYDAIGELVAHGVAADMAEAAALALKAGMDLDMESRAYPDGLKVALDRGLVSLELIDATVARVLCVKERLGLFDAPFGRGDPNRPAPSTRLDRRAIVREAAIASLTLLSNRDGLLPLASTGGRVAVIGPFAEDTAQMIGPWCGLGDQDEIVTIRQGLTAAFPTRELVFARGCAPDYVEDDADEEKDTALIAEAVALAATAEVIVLVLGEPAELSGEAASRADPTLTGRQAELADRVLALGRPTVILMTCGRPLIETDLLERADATLVAWYPGSEGGHAIADVLAGSRAPAGRLPVSWPIAIGQIPVFFGERPSGRPYVPGEHFTTQYLDIPNAPLFPFGHGLSYTTFEIEPPIVSAATFRAAEGLRLSTRVRNAGERAGSTTVYLFARDVVASTSRPLLELKRFETLELASGETREIVFALGAGDFELLGPDLAPCCEPGRFDLSVGFSADRAGLKTISVELRADPVVA
ncbi:MAG: glycoside hydrolase family 3 C-terminal domain-containing protein [Hyphomicrobiales bacterium]|nr:glycoside hydrolase family 3 C-terminal domain-containing protein [Hyphomicrobiales bacterium]